MAPCPGCGLDLPDANGSHPYIGASSGCWKVFGDVQLMGLHRLVGDAYAVQHPGVPGRRAIQSVGLHLMVLCLHFERDMTPEHATTVAQRILARPPDFRWLDPPSPNGVFTVADVADGWTPATDYIRSVWDAWARHHGQVREWVDAATG